MISLKAENNVFRALRPKMEFECSDGSISPSAFKDKKGLSVEIDLDRNDLQVISSMHKYLEGNILKIKVSVCEECDVEIFKDDSPNKYHRLLLNKYRSENDKQLTTEQCIALATATSNKLIKMDFAHNL